MAAFRMSDKRYGTKKELQVGEFLERRGFKWERVQDSRGAFDLRARRGSECWLVQVKATRSGGDPRAAFRRALDEAPALRNEAKRYRKCRPVAAVVEGNYVWFFDVSEQDARLIMEGELKELRREYDEYP
jgi:Holliday junction resolvase-like predicted endonuclease